MSQPDSNQLQFIREELLKGVQKIYAEQRSIAANRIYGRRATGAKPPTGNLMRCLSASDASTSTGMLGVYSTLNYPVYIRFLDMKRNGNLKIYNRPIWGIMYKEVFSNIRYGFGEWLKEYVKRNIEESYNKKNN